MKKYWLVGRIVLTLLVIFILGIVVGRLTTPIAEAPLEVVIVDEKANRLSESRVRRVTRRAMTKYRQELQLTRAQMKDLGPLFLETTRKMDELELRSQARMEQIELFHKKMQPYLTPEQIQLAEKTLAESRSRERN